MYPVNAGQTANLFNAQCTVAEEVGDLVYCHATMVGSSFVVRTADATDINKMPAFGVIIRKIDDTSCVVQTAGVLKNVFGGLTVNKLYMIDESGDLSATYPRPGYVQHIGLALGTSTILLKFDSQLTKVLL